MGRARQKGMERARAGERRHRQKGTRDGVEMERRGCGRDSTDENWHRRDGTGTAKVRAQRRDSAGEVGKRQYV